MSLNAAVDGFPTRRMSVVPVCFGDIRVHETDANLRSANLSSKHAEALSELLAVLLCGEESAALAFDRMFLEKTPSAVLADLTRIAADEQRHQRLLDELRSTLPRPIVDPHLQAMTRRFFMRMADRDPVTHCLRISALDSAVCLILGKLRARKRPLSVEPTINAIFTRIHRDEARHVLIANRCVTVLGGTRSNREIIADTRSRLARVLAHRADAFEALGIEPDTLFSTMRSLHTFALL